MKSRKKQRILIKTATRDYALLMHLKFLIEKWKKEIGIKRLNPLYHYSCKKVRIYHYPPELEASFDILRKRFQSKIFLLRIVKKLNDVVKRLKPYLKKKKVDNKKEFKKLHRKFVEFFSFAELMQIIPDLKEIPKENRKIALNSRKKTHDLIIPIENLVKEYLGKIMNIRKDKIKFLLPEEIFKNKKFTKEDLERRSEGYIYYKYRIYTGKKIDYFIKKENIKFEDEIKSIRERTVIKGQTAYLGKVKGIVKVVLDVKDIYKIKQGNILVADMTLPVYMPGMKKAIAFVTDEGGLASHAAIFSREMKIPCIIGTKIATKVLKDGDLVEVDANKGIVKILGIDKRFR